MKKMLDMIKKYWCKLTTASKIMFIFWTIVSISNLTSVTNVADFISLLPGCFIGYFVFVGSAQLISNRKKKSHNAAPNLLPTDPLPIIATTNLILDNGEKCHYYGKATFVKTKNVVVGYSGGSRGTTVRVAKGVSLRVGAQKSAPVRDDVEERTEGILSITNKRVVFSANKGAFDKKLSTISSVTPYKDRIAFQFGEKQYPLETKEAAYIHQIINRIVGENANN